MNANGESTMGRITVEIALANNQDVQMADRGLLPVEQVRRARLAGVVDTGATHMVLPEQIVQQLGVPLRGDAMVRYTDLRSATRPMAAEISLELAGRSGTFRAIVAPERTTALVGAIVLEDLDLLVDCTNQMLKPRDPEHIVAEIE